LTKYFPFILTTTDGEVSARTGPPNILSIIGLWRYALFGHVQGINHYITLQFTRHSMLQG